MKLLTGRTIKPLDNQVNQEPSLIMKPPFTSYLISQKGGGKSTLLLNLLLSKDLLAGTFHQIYIISPTSALDSKMNILNTTPGICKVNTKLINILKQKGKIQLMDSGISSEREYSTSIPEENFIEEVSIDLLKTLIEEQKSIIEKYSKAVSDKILLIYDDCISNKKFFNSQAVQKLLFNSRHYNVNIIITSQSYKCLNKSLRLNMSQLILFSTSNEKEIQSIYEENSSSLGYKQWLQVYREITDKPFNALVINYQNKKEYRLQDAFEQFVEI